MYERAKNGWNYLTVLYIYEYNRLQTLQVFTQYAILMMRYQE